MIADESDEPGREEIEVVLGRRDARAPPAGHGNGDRDSDRKADVDEGGPQRPPASREQQGAEPEKRRGQQPAEEVVDAEGRLVPARRRSPGKRGRGDGVRNERGTPGGELRSPAGPPASREQASQPQGKKRRRERKERFHDDSLNLS